ncbi:MAG: hypothetical protein JO091_06025 [Acidobacteriaceae bacterium]|nr:hypothetical protein [Acidobacteriaceae bacterium]
MMRAVLELIFTIIVIIVARALLASVLKGFSRAASNSYQQQGSGGPGAGSQPSREAGSELHKDPVCGTYVAESTPFQKRAGLYTFYYCSEECREKHAVVAR